MADFLLELFSEEIPARMQAAAARQLEERIGTLLATLEIRDGVAIETFVTPRRVAALVRNLAGETPVRREERRGPRVDAPEKAIDGFLRSTGLARADLEERDTGKGVFLFAVMEKGGRPVADALAETLPALIEAFDWPKSQRWGPASVSTESPRWVRPLRRIVALLDDKVVSFRALGVASGRVTEGHRFMHEGAIEIGHAADYLAALRAAFVIADPQERAETIANGARAVAEEAGLALVEDEGLIHENAGLTEWPVPFPGRFDPAFLDVPPEIIALTMRTNQKYFALQDSGGNLAPAFVGIANIEAPDGGRAIVAGNERVLSARLSDARFFWEQDLKVPLEQCAGRLSGLLFHEKIGTMAEKVERLRTLSSHLAKTLAAEVNPDNVDRAAQLAKADLLTGTVGEFPELQGIIGGRLAAAQGEAPEVSAALSEHYQQAPGGTVAAIVALADRVDTLSSFFNADIRPTGSRDPFALRRAALSLIEIILSHGMRLNLRPLFETAGSHAPDELVAFIADRLKVQQKKAGVRHDLIDAVFGRGDEDDIVRLLARVEALRSFLGTDDGRNLIAGYRRAANILRIEEKRDGHSYAPDVRAELLKEDAEAALATALDTAVGEAKEALATENFTMAMQALSRLRQPVDRFFEVVTVNTDEAAVRENRLSLLARFRDTADLTADFAKVEG